MINTTDKILASLKNKKMMFRNLGIAIAVMIIGILCLIGYTQRETEALSDKMIRFHVVANSDTTEDQLLKQQVKDTVVAYMEPMLRESHSIDETRALLEENLPILKQLSEQVVAKWNKDYTVQTALGYANFPTKAYGDVILPAGQYEACRIVIGEGKGENWWCVMFPPLCYVDAATGVVPLEGKEELKHTLNEEQYNLVTEIDNKPYAVRFKLIDTINAYLHPDNYKEIK